ncbi:MAG: hypothetical protein CMB08_03635 [Euryarchaeota archaeon]|nr:hypothetical protein [Euryarchaeota archaeon]
MRGGNSINVRKDLPRNLSKMRSKMKLKKWDNLQQISPERKNELHESGYPDIILSRALEIEKEQPYNPEILLDILQYKGNFLKIDKIITLCQKICELEIESKEATEIMIEYYYKKKKWREIVEISNRIDGNIEFEVKNLKKIAIAFRKINSDEGFLEFTSKLGRYSNINYEIIREMAKSYGRLGNNYHSAKLWNKVGLVNLNRSDYKSAIRANYNAKNYKEVIELSDFSEQKGIFDEDIEYIKIRAFYMKNNWEKCVNSCTNSLRRNPKKINEIKDYRSRALWELSKKNERWFDSIPLGR